MDPPAEADPLASVASAWPGREAQVAQLAALLGKPLDAAACVAVCGPPGTGKTGTVRAVLQATRHRAAYASCLECSTPRLLFEALLAQLAPSSPGGDPPAPLYCRRRGWATPPGRAAGRGRGGKGTARCATLAEFVDALRRLAPRDGRATYLVVDEAARLCQRRWGGGPAGGGDAASLLSVLLRLPELTGRNYGCLLLATQPWATFRDGTGACDPLPLHFPPYSTAELQRILHAAPPAPAPGAVGADAVLWAAFVRALTPIFLDSCRSLHELRSLFSLLWRRYTRPLAQLPPGAPPLSSQQLFLQFAARAPAPAGGGFGAVLAAEQPLNTHTSSAVPLSAHALALGAAVAALAEAPAAAPSSRLSDVAALTPASPLAQPVGLTATKLDVELPAKAKFLLLAAYLAANSPPGKDATIFGAAGERAAKDAPEGEEEAAPLSTGQGGRVRGGSATGGGAAFQRRARAEAAEHEEALKGPQPFDLERLIAIYLFLLHAAARDEALNREVLQRTASLVRARGTAADEEMEEVEEGEDGLQGNELPAPRVLYPDGDGECDVGVAAAPVAAAYPGAVFSGPLVSDVFGALASLCELGLLSRTGGDPLEGARFRCAATEGLAKRIAANAGINVVWPRRAGCSWQ